MPELPEVETTCLALRSQFINQVIQKIIIRESRLRWPMTPEIANLKNIKVNAIERRGKYILLRTHQGSLIIHLGMSGRLAVKDLKTAPATHDHVDFIFEKKLLRYTDPRRFGAILWTEKDPLQHDLLSKLGPEPLETSFNAEYLYQKAVARSLMVKEFIMNAKVVVGVGNIYANEALFLAKIKPIRKANTLSMSDCENLVVAIKQVLKKAIAKGGTTLKDFFSPGGNPGYFSQKLQVYDRAHKPCRQCGNPLISIRIANRSTVFCNVCQN